MRHRQLQIWQKGMDLVKKIYGLSLSFPATEQYSLASQLKRAAVSVPSNIAEGSQRKTVKDFKQFLSIACGSLAEIDTQLELATQLQYIDYPESLKQEICILERMIHSFAASLSQDNVKKLGGRNVP